MLDPAEISLVAGTVAFLLGGVKVVLRTRQLQGAEKNKAAAENKVEEVESNPLSNAVFPSLKSSVVHEDLIVDTQERITNNLAQALYQLEQASIASALEDLKIGKETILEDGRILIGAESEGGKSEWVKELLRTRLRSTLARSQFRVDVNDDFELRHWAGQFNVSPEELKDAVEKVGPSTEALRRHLGR